MDDQRLVDSRLRAARDMHDMMAAVKPMANRFEKEMSRVIDAKFKNGVQMFALVLCDLLARVSVVAAEKLHKTDKEAGIKFINSIYDGAKSDALEAWEKGWS